MIPLRASESVPKFPWFSVGAILVFVGAEILARAWPGSHESFLLRQAWSPQVPQPVRAFFTSLWFHPNLFSLVVSIVFLWAFTPRLFLRRPPWLVGALAILGAFLTAMLYSLVFASSQAPVLLSPALVGVTLGLAMRSEIWATVSTVVIGPGWIRLYEVPSYVLLFFWLFYLLLGNLFLPEAFASGPMLYLIPFAGFLTGFAADFFLAQFFDRRPSLPNL